MWSGCMCRFLWQVTKGHDTQRLSSYTIADNKRSLGEIKCAGCDSGSLAILLPFWFSHHAAWCNTRVVGLWSKFGVSKYCIYLNLRYIKNWHDYLFSVYFNIYPLHVSKKRAAHHNELLLYVYSNWYMSWVYVAWLLVVLITKLPTASCGSLHSPACFSTRTHPLSVTLFAIGSSYFQATLFPIPIQQHSQPQLFFVPTPMWRWKKQIVPKCWHIKFRRWELPRRKHSVLLNYLQSLTYCHNVRTTTAFYYFFQTWYVLT